MPTTSPSPREMETLPSSCRIRRQNTSPYSPDGKNTRILARPALVFECSSGGGDSHFTGEENTAHSGFTGSMFDCAVHSEPKKSNRNKSLFFACTCALCL